MQGHEPTSSYFVIRIELHTHPTRSARSASSLFHAIVSGTHALLVVDLRNHTPTLPRRMHFGRHGEGGGGCRGAV